MAAISSSPKGFNASGKMAVLGARASSSWRRCLHSEQMASRQPHPETPEFAAALSAALEGGDMAFTSAREVCPGGRKKGKEKEQASEKKAL
jgi:hypothetical protein